MDSDISRNKSKFQIQFYRDRPKVDITPYFRKFLQNNYPTYKTDYRNVDFPTFTELYNEFITGFKRFMYDNDILFGDFNAKEIFYEPYLLNEFDLDGFMVEKYWLETLLRNDNTRSKRTSIPPDKYAKKF